MFCRKKKLDPDKETSKEIDKWLKDANKKELPVKKLLLLGTGESGKTTIIKQMKIIHINGFSDEEKQEKVKYIRQNIHEAMYVIVFNMDKISPAVELQQESSLESAQFILDYGPSNSAQEIIEPPQEFYDHAKILWQDSGVKDAFRRSNEFQLIDSAGHFLKRIDEIRKEDYVPTIDDILFCRIRTIGISNIEFSMPVPGKYGGGTAKFCMYDVGGQRGERLKWIQVFSGINAVLFLIAASDFDLNLREDEKENRLKEAFKLFSDMCWSRYLRESGMIVFLNKQDLLRGKIENGHSLGAFFPEYIKYECGEKTSDEYEKAKFFMRDKILSIAKKKPQPENIALLPGVTIQTELHDRDVYVHFTTATDTKNIKLVFNSVHDIILKSNLSKAIF